MTVEPRDLPRNSDGTLAAFAWPGHYPMFYICQDMGTLCPKCANANAELTGDTNDPQWNVVAAEVNWEDGQMTCDNCNERIPSAYAEPE